MTDKNFTGANEAADDEMCILVGDGLAPFCTPMAAKKDQTLYHWCDASSGHSGRGVVV